MIKPLAAADSVLFQGLFDGVAADTGIQMWMSHGDKVGEERGRVSGGGNAVSGAWAHFERRKSWRAVSRARVSPIPARSRSFPVVR
jgi:hypothetical protein